MKIILAARMINKKIEDNYTTAIGLPARKVYDIIKTYIKQYIYNYRMEI